MPWSVLTDAVAMLRGSSRAPAETEDRCYFSDLPPEIRQQIYDYILEPVELKVPLWGYLKNKPFNHKPVKLKYNDAGPGNRYSHITTREYFDIPSGTLDLNRKIRQEVHELLSRKFHFVQITTNNLGKMFEGVFEFNGINAVAPRHRTVTLSGTNCIMNINITKSNKAYAHLDGGYARFMMLLNHGIDWENFCIAFQDGHRDLGSWAVRWFATIDIHVGCTAMKLEVAQRYRDLALKYIREDWRGFEGVRVAGDIDDQSAKAIIGRLQEPNIKRDGEPMFRQLKSRDT